MKVHKNIFTAVREGNLEEVEKLLEAGANVHAKNEAGATALMFAAQDGHTEIVKVLLEKGADVDAKNKDGNTALILAARNGHAAVVEKLLKAGADVHDRNRFGQTALMFAAKNGRTAVVAKLLKAGANVHVKNEDGNTALILAARNGHAEVKELLLKNTQDIGTLIYYGKFIKAGRIIGEKITSTLLALGQKLSAAVSSIKNMGIDSLLYLLYFASFSMLASIMTLSLVVLPLVSTPVFAILMAACIIVHYTAIFSLLFGINQFPEITVATAMDESKTPIAKIVSIDGVPIASPVAANKLNAEPPRPSAPPAETSTPSGDQPPSYESLIVAGEPNTLGVLPPFPTF